MADEEQSLATTTRNVRRVLPNAKVVIRVAQLLVASASAATVLGMAAPAQAEPTDPYIYVSQASDDTFLGAIDRLGLGNLGPGTVDTAKAACAHIQNGHSVREAVDGVQGTYPSLPLLQSAHFVAVARAIYCPSSLTR